MAPTTRSRSASYEASFRVAKSSGKTSTSNKSSKAARDAPTRNEVTDKRLSELQKLCITYKVSANGTRIELIKRLLKHINYGQVGDAILVTEARIPGQNGTIANVREALRGALENTTFNVREILGRTFIGDSESLEYAAARMEIPQVRHTVDELKERAETAENQVREMENELNQCKDLMLSVRMRFINCFKRDKLGATGDPLIAEVSRLVHSGDAITDARLFAPDGPREDEDVYEKLYGFTPEEVRRIGGKFSLCPVNELWDIF